MACTAGGFFRFCLLCRRALGECEIRATAVGRLSSLMPCDDDTLTGDNSDPIGLAPDPHLVCLSHNSPRVPHSVAISIAIGSFFSFFCVLASDTRATSAWLTHTFLLNRQISGADWPPSVLFSRSFLSSFVS